MSDNLDAEAIDRLVELGRNSAGPQTVAGGNIPYVVVPGNYRIQPVGDLIFNEHSERPERIRANVAVLDTVSFAEYWKKFADSDSRIFSYEPELSVTGVIDYHQGPGQPRWGHHRLTLTLRKSEEWTAWVNKNDYKFDQMGFAEFLEQNGLAIIEPSPATMMEIARDLEGKKEVEFGSGVRTDSGQIRFKYSETVKASMANGQIEVPERFKLAMPVFIGGGTMDIEALLRYRINSGKLTLWYSLIRPEAIMRHAFNNSRNAIAEMLEVEILNGKP